MLQYLVGLSQAFGSNSWTLAASICAMPRISWSAWSPCPASTAAAIAALKATASRSMPCRLAGSECDTVWRYIRNRWVNNLGQFLKHWTCCYSKWSKHVGPCTVLFFPEWRKWWKSTLKWSKLWGATTNGSNIVETLHGTQQFQCFPCRSFHTDSSWT